MIQKQLFLSYGYNKLFSAYKVRLPNIFQLTCFKKHKDFLKNDDKGESSTLFCYLPSTTDRKESINQYKGNVQLHPIDCAYEKFSEFSSKKATFYSHHLESNDLKEREIAKEIFINFMKHIMNISNANLTRNGNCLVINGNVGNEVKIVGMEVESKKFKLSY